MSGRWLIVAGLVFIGFAVAGAAGALPLRLAAWRDLDRLVIGSAAIGFALLIAGLAVVAVTAR